MSSPIVPNTSVDVGNLAQQLNQILVYKIYIEKMPSTSYLDKNYKSTHYNNVRPSYPKTLITEILNYHMGPCERLVDVGCGTGKATVLFKDNFKEIVGVDPSESMLKSFADVIENDVAESERGKFKLIKAPGESFPEVENSSVDLVIGAESIHWCDMPKLFNEVNRVLRDDGTFAFWFYCQPEFMDLGPKAHEIYYKYGWSEQFMGKYLTAEQRAFFNTFGGPKLPELLGKEFRDIEFRKHDALHKDIKEVSSFYMDGSMTLQDFKGLVKSWSLYASWKRDHPDEPDIADTFIDELKTECSVESESTPLRVEWDTFHYLCRKK
ncbi:S-adenosylmethionine-dependent methyltransferase NDAI_0I02680 [Naumovozyma dairenensis CBS 421]|uniref:Methyltransferase type 11 domain-containing protein n=1 Tax=Naumovozyma dairenensis (strain ATCC 10597 / BCRC 20456 / CBS 421 / NBRC 0211 / NRRL Y-12639) TaxID=1071378 RepID=G0WGC5_NAUDC|nr:hypothetical protein NDAI_0I02680 [Naumovozyma dairenensis CBS 421]CCD26836.1 hypothetical protein NDAI_0I02680 [Naumovozyma dairenensis CBS 421]